MVRNTCVIDFQIEDFRQLDGVVQSAKSVAIVGGSFLGSELAVGLASRGKLVLVYMFVK